MIDDISDLHPSANLSCDDLVGKPQTVVIESVERGEAAGVEGIKTILRFKGIPKPLVSNTTNDYSIALLLGRSPSTWAGKRIVLSPASSSFGKDTVPCIRVTDSPDAPEARRKLLAGIRTANPDTKPVLLGRALKLALAMAEPRTATKEK
jgi:hypothetical protein